MQTELDTTKAAAVPVEAALAADRARRIEALAVSLRDKKRSLLDVVKAQQASLEEDVDRVSSQLLHAAAALRELTQSLADKESLTTAPAGEVDAASLPTAEELSQLRSAIMNQTMMKV
jgi:hypothetical protein